MKTLFIDAKSDADISIPKDQIKKLPKKVGIATTIQHLHKIKDIQKQIPGSIIAGQILGCSAEAAKNIENKVDAFLYIGSGEFHPLEIAYETKKEVFCFNPSSKKLSKITQADVQRHEARKRTSLIKFLSADKVGIMVSTKPGQNRMEDAEKLSKRKDKEYFLFAFDTLSELDMDNFPFIQCWVNTACPRIADGKPNIINIDDIPKNN